jgi:hypothetical protein
VTMTTCAHTTGCAMGWVSATSMLRIAFCLHRVRIHLPITRYRTHLQPAPSVHGTYRTVASRHGCRVFGQRGAPLVCGRLLGPQVSSSATRRSGLSATLLGRAPTIMLMGYVTILVLCACIHPKPVVRSAAELWMSVSLLKHATGRRHRAQGRGLAQSWTSPARLSL